MSPGSYWTIRYLCFIPIIYYNMRSLKKFFLLLPAIFFMTCSPEEDLAYPRGAKTPNDKGVYEWDEKETGIFCDFAFLPNPGCWSAEVDVYRDCHYNLLFTRYGNGWTGADATYSTLLPDGRILWMFGDTFLGTVYADRSREGSPFIRNSFVIQDKDELITLYQGAARNPSAIVKPEQPGEWYWPLDATVFDGKVQMMLGRLGSSGTGGLWDFGYRGFDLAVFSLPGLKQLSVSNKIDDPEISYGSCLLEEANYIYIYGISTDRLQKKAHVARARGGDLSGEWEFYNGAEWTRAISKFAIQDGVSDQFSVFKDGGKYYLLTHEIIFGEEIFLYEADTPVGPWRNKRTIYCTPETGGDIFTYNSFVHPELSENGELRVSYNINSFNFQDLFENADLYRPKFIRVDNWK